jgi:hypothetical protein
MQGNWDAAVAAAAGEYVTIMGDKLAYYPHALARLAVIIEADAPQVITYAHENFHDHDGRHEIVLRQHDKHLRAVPTEELIQTFFTQHLSHIALTLPRGYNSMTHHSLLQTIRQSPAGAVTLPATPDYTFGFLHLAFVEQVWHLNEILYVVGAIASNGRAFSMKQAQNFFDEIGDEGLFYDRVPIKNPHLVPNLLLNDFYRVQALVGGYLTGHQHDPVAYYHLNMEDIIQRELRFPAVDFTEERRAWADALAAEVPEVRQAVAERVAPLATQQEVLYHLDAMRDYRRAQLQTTPQAPQDILQAMEAVRHLRG